MTQETSPVTLSTDSSLGQHKVPLTLLVVTHAALLWTTCHPGPILMVKHFIHSQNPDPLTDFQ